MNLSEMCIFRFACCSSHKYKEKLVAKVYAHKKGVDYT